VAVLPINSDVRRSAKFAWVWFAPLQALESILPVYQIDPDAYRFEARSLRIGSTPEALKTLTLRWIMWVSAPIVLIWMISLIGMMTLPRPELIYHTGIMMTLMAFIISLMDRFVVDIAAVIAGLPALDKDIRNGHWDRAYLAGMSASKYVQVKHSVVQARIWHLTLFFMVMRTLVATSFFSAAFIVPLFFPNEPTIYNVYRDLPSMASPLIPFAILLVMVLLYGYIIEPRWRVRSLTAASLAVSAKQQQSPYGICSALGAILSIWFAQLLLVIFGLSAIIGLPMMLGSGTATALYIIVCTLNFSLMLRKVYEGLERFWLKRAKIRLGTR